MDGAPNTKLTAMEKNQYTDDVGARCVDVRRRGCVGGKKHGAAEPEPRPAESEEPAESDEE